MPWLAAAIGVALCAPSLGLGLVVDDHFLRLALHRPPPLPDWSRGWIDLFAFFDGRPGLVRRAMDLGSAPWWPDQRLRIAFFRPLAGREGAGALGPGRAERGGERPAGGDSSAQAARNGACFGGCAARRALTVGPRGPGAATARRASATPR